MIQRLHTFFRRFLYPDTNETVAYLQSQLAARFTQRYLVFAVPLNVLINLNLLIQVVVYDIYPMSAYLIDVIRLVIVVIVPALLVRRGYISLALLLIFIPGIILLLIQVWFMANTTAYALSVFLFLVPALVFRPRLTAIILMSTNILYILLVLVHPTIRDDPTWLASVVAVVTAVSIFVFIFAEINWLFRSIYINYMDTEHQRRDAELQAQIASERVHIYEQYWELVRSVQHDLRSPSTALTRTVQLLRHKVIPEAKRDYFLYQTEMLALRLRMRVEALFDDARSRSRATYREPINLHAVITQYLPELQDLIALDAHYTARQQPTISFQAACSAWIQGSSDQIQRILENTILNSVAAGADVIQIRLDGTPEEIVLSVQDNGSGFPETMLNGAIQSHRRGGSGLGLLGVCANVQMLDGTIQFTNQSGARIEMQFPRVMEHENA